MAENINKIYCRFVTGMTVEVQLRPQTTTVALLKQQLSELINLSPEKLYIGFEVNMLKDEEYLKTAGIVDGDTVHVITSQLTEKIQYKAK
ncbi:hypothetical protein pb186bvf_013377 [Paramecium bursaria]